MFVYRISAIQGQISFKKTVRAHSYNDAKSKFMLEENKNNRSFPYIAPNIVIESIFRES